LLSEEEEEEEEEEEWLFVWFVVVVEEVDEVEAEVEAEEEEEELDGVVEVLGFDMKKGRMRRSEPDRLEEGERKEKANGKKEFSTKTREWAEKVNEFDKTQNGIEGIIQQGNK
jgi:hypothetical protein